MWAFNKLLLVDDEVDLVEAMAFEFELEGFMTLTADSVDAALKLLNEHQDLLAIISDMRMPGKTGVDLLDAVRSRNPKLPVIFLMTGYAEMTEEEVIQRGAEALFTKPICVDLVMKKLKQLRDRINAA